MNIFKRLPSRLTLRIGKNRPRAVLSFLAIAAVVIFLAAPLAVAPGSTDSPWFSFTAARGQNILVSGAGVGLEREEFGVGDGFGIAPEPGTAQAAALEQVTERGWDRSEFSCLVSLWSKESGWNHGAQNPESGAYGIPQALPGNKMASAGSDWATNPATQIRWGLGYIEARYGSPCQAWGHSVAKNWY
ncbi:MAG TPA: hypothetical protein DCE05_05215 [Microbacteriaceae bacterium]|nr:hypothetical protein [Microbacteriaceae bacterium]